MTEAEFWLLIRRALKMIVTAIERRYLPDKATKVEATDTDTVATWMNDK